MRNRKPCEYISWSDSPDFRGSESAILESDNEGFNETSLYTDLPTFSSTQKLTLLQCLQMIGLTTFGRWQRQVCQPRLNLAHNFAHIYPR